MSTPAASDIIVNEPNRWRLESPGSRGWTRTARPGAPNKYFIVSADCHANEPSSLWADRIDQKYKDRVPRVITDDKGVQWRISEGHRPDRLRLSDLEGEDMARQKAGADPRDRPRDQDRDGVDAEVVFPNKGLSMCPLPIRSSPRPSAACGTTGRGRPSGPTWRGCRRRRRWPRATSRAPSPRCSAWPSWAFAS